MKYSKETRTMKLTTPTCTGLLLVAMALGGIVLPARAQDSGSFSRPPHPRAR